MRRAHLVLAATATDWLVGDPESWPHPVRLLGWMIARGDRWLASPRRSDRVNFLAGAALTTITVGFAYLATATLLRCTSRLHPRAGTALELLLASTCLAARSLDDEAGSVLRALGRGDLPGARLRVARIVGRDTATLDESGVSRALIETLAESACDGVVAPLFFLALGGVPLAMAFKAVSTLDSMIGHRDERYLFFGRTAARLDDALNFVPARLTAAAIVACGPQRLALSVPVWRRDARKHASPNAGHPEAAMAATLGVRLGGTSTYGGTLSNAPLLAAEYPQPTSAQARQARTVTRGVSLLAGGVAFAVCLLLTRRRAH